MLRCRPGIVPAFGDRGSAAWRECAMPCPGKELSPYPYIFSTWRAITIFITSLAPSVMR
jgi:hypothetical protein